MEADRLAGEGVQPRAEPRGNDAFRQGEAEAGDKEESPLIGVEFRARIEKEIGSAAVDEGPDRNARVLASKRRDFTRNSRSLSGDCATKMPGMEGTRSVLPLAIESALVRRFSVARRIVGQR